MSFDVMFYKLILMQEKYTSVHFIKIAGNFQVKLVIAIWRTYHVGLAKRIIDDNWSCSLITHMDKNIKQQYKNEEYLKFSTS